MITYNIDTPVDSLIDVKYDLCNNQLIVYDNSTNEIANIDLSGTDISGIDIVRDINLSDISSINLSIHVNETNQQIFLAVGFYNLLRFYGEENYIKGLVRTFVLTRANGFSFNLEHEIRGNEINGNDILLSPDLLGSSQYTNYNSFATIGKYVKRYGNTIAILITSEDRITSLPYKHGLIYLDLETKTIINYLDLGAIPDYEFGLSIDINDNLGQIIVGYQGSPTKGEVKYYKYDSLKNNFIDDNSVISNLNISNNKDGISVFILDYDLFACITNTIDNQTNTSGLHKKSINLIGLFDDKLYLKNDNIKIDVYNDSHINIKKIDNILSIVISDFDSKKKIYNNLIKFYNLETKELINGYNIVEKNNPLNINPYIYNNLLINKYFIDISNNIEEIEEKYNFNYYNSNKYIINDNILAIEYDDNLKTYEISNNKIILLSQLDYYDNINNLTNNIYQINNNYKILDTFNYKLTDAFTGLVSKIEDTLQNINELKMKNILLSNKYIFYTNINVEINNTINNIFYINKSDYFTGLINEFINSKIGFVNDIIPTDTYSVSALFFGVIYKKNVGGEYQWTQGEYQIVNETDVDISTIIENNVTIVSNPEGDKVFLIYDKYDRIVLNHYTISHNDDSDQIHTVGTVISDNIFIKHTDIYNGETEVMSEQDYIQNHKLGKVVLATNEEGNVVVFLAPQINTLPNGKGQYGTAYQIIIYRKEDLGWVLYDSLQYDFDFRTLKDTELILKITDNEIFILKKYNNVYSFDIYSDIFGTKTQRRIENLSNYFNFDFKDNINYSIEDIEDIDGNNKFNRINFVSLSEGDDFTIKTIDNILIEKTYNKTYTFDINKDGSKVAVANIDYSNNVIEIGVFGLSNNLLDGYIGNTITFNSEYLNKNLSITLNDSGNRFAVGLYNGEDSDVVKLYELQNNVWEQLGTDITSLDFIHFGNKIYLPGRKIKLTSDGSKLFVLAREKVTDTDTSSLKDGIIFVYKYIDSPSYSKKFSLFHFTFSPFFKTSDLLEGLSFDINNNGTRVIVCEYVDNIYTKINVYEIIEETWNHEPYIDGSNFAGLQNITNKVVGNSVCMNNDGTKIAYTNSTEYLDSYLNTNVTIHHADITDPTLIKITDVKRINQEINKGVLIKLNGDGNKISILTNAYESNDTDKALLQVYNYNQQNDDWDFLMYDEFVSSKPLTMEFNNKSNVFVGSSEIIGKYNILPKIYNVKEEIINNLTINNQLKSYSIDINNDGSKIAVANIGGNYIQILEISNNSWQPIANNNIQLDRDLINKNISISYSEQSNRIVLGLYNGTSTDVVKVFELDNNNDWKQIYGDVLKGEVGLKLVKISNSGDKIIIGTPDVINVYSVINGKWAKNAYHGIQIQNGSYRSSNYSYDISNIIANYSYDINDNFDRIIVGYPDSLFRGSIEIYNYINNTNEAPIWKLYYSRRNVLFNSDSEIGIPVSINGNGSIFSITVSDREMNGYNKIITKVYRIIENEIFEMGQDIITHDHDVYYKVSTELNSSGTKIAILKKSIEYYTNVNKLDKNVLENKTFHASIDVYEYNNDLWVQKDKEIDISDMSNGTITINMNNKGDKIFVTNGNVIKNQNINSIFNGITKIYQQINNSEIKPYVIDINGDGSIIAIATASARYIQIYKLYNNEYKPYGNNIYDTSLFIPNNHLNISVADQNSNTDGTGIRLAIGSYNGTLDSIVVIYEFDGVTEVWNKLGSSIISSNIRSIGRKVKISKNGNRLFISGKMFGNNDLCFIKSYEYKSITNVNGVDKYDWSILGNTIYFSYDKNIEHLNFDINIDGTKLIVSYSLSIDEFLIDLYTLQNNNWTIDENYIQHNTIHYKSSFINGSQILMCNNGNMIINTVSKESLVNGPSGFITKILRYDDIETFQWEYSEVFIENDENIDDIIVKTSLNGDQIAFLISSTDEYNNKISTFKVYGYDTATKTWDIIGMEKNIEDSINGVLSLGFNNDGTKVIICNGNIEKFVGEDLFNFSVNTYELTNILVPTESNIEITNIINLNDDCTKIAVLNRDLSSVSIYNKINEIWQKIGNDISGVDTTKDINLSIAKNRLAIGEFDLNLSIVNIYELDTNNKWVKLGNYFSSENYNHYGSILKFTNDGLKLFIGGYKSDTKEAFILPVYYDINENKWNIVTIEKLLINNNNSPYFSFDIDNSGNTVVVSNKINDYESEINVYNLVQSNINEFKEWKKDTSFSEYISNRYYNSSYKKGVPVSMNIDGSIISISVSEKSLVYGRQRVITKVFKNLNNLMINWVQLGSDIINKNIYYGYYGSYSKLNSSGDKIAILSNSNIDGNYNYSSIIDVYNYSNNLNEWYVNKTILDIEPISNGEYNMFFDEIGKKIFIARSNVETRIINGVLNGMYEHILEIYSTKNYTIDINNDGSKIAIANSSGSILQLFDVTGNNWVPIGNNIHTGLKNSNNNISLSIDSSGIRLAVCCYSNDIDDTSYLTYADKIDVIKVYELKNNIWSQIGNTINSGPVYRIRGKIKMSSNGSTIVVGANINGLNNNSAAILSFKYNNYRWDTYSSALPVNSTGLVEGFSFDINNDASILLIGSIDVGNRSRVELYKYDNRNIQWDKDNTIYTVVDDYYTTLSITNAIPVTINNIGDVFAISVLDKTINGEDIISTKVFELDSTNSNWKQKGTDITDSYISNNSLYSKINQDGSVISIISEYDDRSELKVYGYNNYEWNMLGNITDITDLSTYGPLTMTINDKGDKVIIGSGNVEFTDLGTIYNGLTKIYEYLIETLTNTHAIDINNDGSRIAVSNVGGNYIQILEVFGNVWTPIGNNIEPNVDISSNISISSDASGNTIAICSYNGSVTKDVVNVYNLNSNNKWEQKGGTIYSSGNKLIGRGVKLSSDGSRLVVGGFITNSNNNGFIRSYDYDNVNDKWVANSNDIDVKSSGNLEGFNFDIDSLGETIITGYPVSKYEGMINLLKYDNVEKIWVVDISFISISLINYYNSSLITGIPVSINDDGTIISFNVSDKSLLYGTQKVITKIYERSTNGNWNSVGSDILTTYNEGNYYGVYSKLNSTGDIVSIISDRVKYNNTSNSFVDIYLKTSSSSNWIQRGKRINLTDTMYNGPLTVALDEFGNKVIVAGGYVEDYITKYIEQYELPDGSIQRIQPDVLCGTQYHGIINIYSYEPIKYDHTFSLDLNNDGSIIAVFNSKKSEIDVFDTTTSPWSRIGTTISTTLDFNTHTNISLTTDIINNDINYYLSFCGKEKITGNNVVKNYKNDINVNWQKYGQDISGQDLYGGIDGLPNMKILNTKLSEDGKKMVVGGHLDGSPNDGIIRTYEYTSVGVLDIWIEYAEDLSVNSTGILDGFSYDINKDMTILVVGSSISQYEGKVNVYKLNEITEKWDIQNFVNNTYYNSSSTVAIPVTINKGGDIISFSVSENSLIYGPQPIITKVFVDNSNKWISLGDDILTTNENFQDYYSLYPQLNDTGYVLGILINGIDYNDNYISTLDLHDYNGKWQNLYHKIYLSDLSDGPIKLSINENRDEVNAYSGYLTNTDDFIPLERKYEDIFNFKNSFTIDTNGNGKIIALANVYNNYIKIYNAPYNGNLTNTINTNTYSKIIGLSGNQIGNTIEPGFDASGNVSISISDDGKVLAIGNYNYSLNTNTLNKVTVYELDDLTNTWIQKGGTIDSCGNKLIGGGVKLSSDGSRLFIGGYVYNSVDDGFIKSYEYIGGGTSNDWIDLANEIQVKSSGKLEGFSFDIDGPGETIVIGYPVNRYKGIVKLLTLDDQDDTWNTIETYVGNYNSSFTLGIPVSINKLGTVISFNVSHNSLLLGPSIILTKLYIKFNGSWVTYGKDILTSYKDEGDYYGVTSKLNNLGNTIAIVSNGLINTNNKSINVYNYSSTKWNKIGETIDISNLSYGCTSMTVNDYGNRITVASGNIGNTSGNSDSITLLNSLSNTFMLHFSKISNVVFNGNSVTTTTETQISNSLIPTASGSGDPHIYPLFGEHYELPQIPSYYRLVQGKKLIINCSTRYLTDKETESIIKYIQYNSNEIINETYLHSLISRGVFYDKVYINSDGNQLLFSFADNNLVVFESNPNKNYFVLDKKLLKNEELYGNKYEIDNNILQFKIRFQNTNYGKLSFDFNYFQNPQIKYGIGMSYDKNYEELSGLLLREYQIKSMQIKKIKYSKPRKGKISKNKQYSKFVKVIPYKK